MYDTRRVFGTSLAPETRPALSMIPLPTDTLMTLIARPALAASSRPAPLQAAMAKVRVYKTSPSDAFRLTGKHYQTIYDFVPKDALSFEERAVVLKDGTNVVTRVESLQDPVAIKNERAANAFSYKRDGYLNLDKPKLKATGQRLVIVGKRVETEGVYLNGRERQLMKQKLHEGFRALDMDGHWIRSGYELEWQHPGRRRREGCTVDALGDA